MVLKNLWILLAIQLLQFPILFCEENFIYQNKPENLQSLFLDLLKAKREKNDEVAAKISHSIVPSMEDIKAIFRQDVNPKIMGLVEKYVQVLNSPTEYKQYAGLFLARDEQTEVQVHAATTEEILEYKQGSVAWKEFPGGTQKVAVACLKPGVVFYEVEFLKQGEGSGIKYHLFFWNGQQWKMLGPLWRLLRKVSQNN